MHLLTSSLSSLFLLSTTVTLAKVVDLNSISQVIKSPLTTTEPTATIHSFRASLYANSEYVQSYLSYCPTDEYKPGSHQESTCFSKAVNSILSTTGLDPIEDVDWTIDLGAAIPMLTSMPLFADARDVTGRAYLDNVSALPQELSSAFLSCQTANVCSDGGYLDCYYNVIKTFPGAIPDSGWKISKTHTVCSTPITGWSATHSIASLSASPTAAPLVLTPRIIQRSDIPANNTIIPSPTKPASSENATTTLPKFPTTTDSLEEPLFSAFWNCQESFWFSEQLAEVCVQSTWKKYTSAERDTESSMEPISESFLTATKTQPNTTTIATVSTTSKSISSLAGVDMTGAGSQKNAASTTQLYLSLSWGRRCLAIVTVVMVFYRF